jgi:hypothetical protein
MTDHAELPPRSFFNADDLSLLIMEHPDAPQFLAVKIADAHDAALAALVVERDRYKVALKPFADASEGLEPNDYDARVVAWIGNAEPNGGGAYGLHASDFRRARAALAQEPTS